MKETQSFEGEQGGKISRNLTLGTMGNLRQAFSSNDLSWRLLKIEQKSTIASFFLKLVENGFLYRL